MQLNAAHEMFARMGAERFADLAAAELRATGERARARSPETVVDGIADSGSRRGRGVE